MHIPTSSDTPLCFYFKCQIREEKEALAKKLKAMEGKILKVGTTLLENQPCSQRMSLV